MIIFWCLIFSYSLWVCLSMPHNVQGLALCRYSVLRQPGYVADQRYEVENIFYSLELFVSWICR